MSDKLETAIEAMAMGADLIANDMQRQFGQPSLVCTTCGHRRFGTWGYLRTGWPQHCGYTMRLVTGR